jgi:hypothetical protein
MLLHVTWAFSMSSSQQAVNNTRRWHIRKMIFKLIPVTWIVRLFSILCERVLEWTLCNFCNASNWLQTTISHESPNHNFTRRKAWRDAKHKWSHHPKSSRMPSIGRHIWKFTSTISAKCVALKMMWRLLLVVTHVETVCAQIATRPGQWWHIPVIVLDVSLCAKSLGTIS